jgi:hypothetical protein
MPRILQAKQFDAKLGAVLLQLANLFGRRLDRDRRTAEHLLGACRRSVIHGGESQIGTPDFQPPFAEHRKCLR